MKNLLFAVCFVACSLWLATTSTEAESVQPDAVDSIAASASTDHNAKYQSLVQELKVLRDGLTEKQAELVKLRHKWTVSKGRTPTEQEVKDFEAKRAKGEVTVEDNPYVNKSAISSPARARAAYYQKLAEIKKDRERVLHLEQELDALKR
jgi:hypothetical protein